MRHALPAVAVAAVLQWPIGCLAQTGARQADPAMASQPTLGHAAIKGLTLKLLTMTTSGVIFYGGTGSLAVSGWMSALVGASSYAIYVGNDYLWDRFWPANQSQAGDASFDTKASVWRNTGKFLTFKPTVVAASWGIIYLFTGSWSSTVVMGSVNSLALPVVFYLNNVGWDWYDWYHNPATTPPAR